MFIESEVFDKHFHGELGSLFVSSIRRAIEVCVNEDPCGRLGYYVVVADESHALKSI